MYFHLKKKTKEGLFSSVTSPLRKPCVCHTHTEKQALYNGSVKSPCSKDGEGLGVGVGVVGWAPAGKEKSWRA